MRAIAWCMESEARNLILFVVLTMLRRLAPLRSARPTIWQSGIFPVVANLLFKHTPGLAEFLLLLTAAMRTRQAQMQRHDGDLLPIPWSGDVNSKCLPDFQWSGRVTVPGILINAVKLRRCLLPVTSQTVWIVRCSL
jgi:hypothetical protein